MKRLTASIIIGPLLLIGPLPAVAGQPVPAATSSQLVANDDATADRDNYTQTARVDVQEWQHKLHEFDATAVANGTEAGNKAASDLDDAWSKAEAASWNLQDAGTEGWANAKATYEKASPDLADAWNRVPHEDK